MSPIFAVVLVALSFSQLVNGKKHGNGLECSHGHHGHHGHQVDCKCQTYDPASIRDCSDNIEGNGKNLINIASKDQDPSYLDVLCENRWMVLLRRYDGSVQFNKTWTDYRDGFGQLDEEYWAGLELMHRVTNNHDRNYSLRVDFEIYNGTQSFAEYTSFSVGPASENYTLHVSGYSSISSLGDSLSYHNGARFSTIDKDHDTHPTESCSRHYGSGGGWWNYSCYNAMLTGQHGEYPAVKQSGGIVWRIQWGYDIFARRVSMKIRRI